MRTDNAGMVILSVREAQVLRLLCSTGASNKELATALSMSERTAAGYVNELNRRLHTANRTQLALWGLRHPNCLCGEPCWPISHPAGCKCGEGLCAILDIAA